MKEVYLTDSGSCIAGCLRSLCDGTGLLGENDRCSWNRRAQNGHSYQGNNMRSQQFMSSRCVRLLSASWPGSRCRSAQRTQHLSRRQDRIQDHFDALLLPTYLILFQAGYGLPSTHPLSKREKRITHRPPSHPHKLFPSSSTRSKRSSPLDGAFSSRLTSVFARTVLE
jgi:hypothetical protein